MAEVARQLSQVSAATVDRLLGPYGCKGGRRPFTITKRGGLLKRAIPMRTSAQSDGVCPRFLEVDLVGHCGESTEGFYLTTLCAVDVVTSRVECEGVCGKGQGLLGSAALAIKKVELRYSGLFTCRTICTVVW